MNESQGKAVGWCSTVIRHAAIHAKKKKRKTAREVLLMNHATAEGSEWGEKITSPDIGPTFSHVELVMVLNELPPTESRVIRKLFLDGYTQQRLAREMNTCQQQISRIKNRGIQMLRERML